MKINTTKFYKAFQLMALSVLPFIGNKVYAQTVVKWNSTNASNTFTGTAELGGSIGTVTATVTISTNTNPKYGSYNSSINPSNNIAYTGNNPTAMNSPDLPAIRSALGVSDDLTWFYTFKDGRGYPKVVSIKFDKNVIVSKLAMTDLEQKVDNGGAWSENFTISGYTFNSVAASNFKQKTAPTITASGIDFGSSGMTDVDTPNNVGTAIFSGGNILTANTNLVVTFDGTTAYKTNTGTNVSNEANPFAIFISAPCNAGTTAPQVQ